MATALLGGHVNRAIDFLKTSNMYFVIGGTLPWDNEIQPKEPDLNGFQLVDVVGLKSVDSRYLVVKDNPSDGEIIDENIRYIQYRDQRWRVVPEKISTIISKEISEGDTEIELASTDGLVKKSRIRINNTYEGTITNISGNIVTLDSAAPKSIALGSPVLGGAIVDGAKYVYVDCTLSYDAFPVVTYRQIGLCTGVIANSEVTPKVSGILVSAGIDGREVNEYESLGVLEILDNRAPSTRSEDQKEQLSLIIEF